MICLYLYIKIKRGKTHETTFIPIYYELTRIGICYALFGLSYAAMKFSVGMPRPFCSLPPEEFKTIVDTTYERCLSSFPSAHTGLAILASYCIWQYLGNKMKIFAGIIVVLVAISRITLAMHYPSDILYSIALTIFIINLGNLTYRMLKNIIIKPLGQIIMRVIF
jgi:membrane-associated phospholipid phosphatase